MKKIITVVCLLIFSLSFAACSSVGSKAGEVTIVYVSEGSDVIKMLTTSKADYGLIAEPAATNALNNETLLTKIEKKSIDVQQEWKKLTNLDGFPQAVLFAKNSVDSALINLFLENTKNAGDWAKNNPAKAVEVIKSNALAGTDSTMPNITDGKIVERCNINSMDTGLKEYIGTFLEKIDGTKPKDDGIYYVGGVGGDKSTLKVYMPDGATALALAYMMENYKTIDGVNVQYNVVPPETIASYVKNGSGDIVLLPTTAAISLYNNGANYNITSVMTHGNLFIIGTDNLADLNGKTVVSIGEGNIPAMVLNYILKQNKLEVNKQDE